MAILQTFVGTWLNHSGAQMLTFCPLILTGFRDDRIVFKFLQIINVSTEEIMKLEWLKNLISFEVPECCAMASGINVHS